jgi:NAD(P)-dependent dehydrogenase (short-subunit alcohol dehydrogenase family)
MTTAAGGHDLVVGGTGMLFQLCVELARTGRKVSVLARDPSRLQRLAEAESAIHPVPADYTDARALERALSAAIRRRGAIERAICWIHDTAPAAPLAIATHVGSVYCHVLGSAAANPAAPEILARWRAQFAALPGLDYRIVVLGFVPGRSTGASRWLTDAEICQGVGRALAVGGPISIVGAVEPWSARP